MGGGIYLLGKLPPLTLRPDKIWPKADTNLKISIVVEDLSVFQSMFQRENSQHLTGLHKPPQTPQTCKQGRKETATGPPSPLKKHRRLESGISASDCSKLAGPAT